MKLSILVPAFNEIASIEEILKRINAVSLPIDREIIIVDDGSTDGTRDFLTGLSDDHIKVYFHERNQGKGRAIRTALEHTTGDIIIVQDADLEYDPQDYNALIEPILNNQASVVYGNRRGHNSMTKSYARYYWGGRLVTAVTNILFNTKIHDEPVCYKVFKKEVLDKITLRCTQFEFCPEVTAKVSKLGYRIHEVPIQYYPRHFDTGKKITWKDGLEAVWVLVKYRFVD